MRRLVLLLLLGLPAAPAAAQQPVLSQPAHTTVKAYGGLALVSRADADGFHLAVTDAAGAITDLPFAPQAGPFDADIGPGPDARPTVVASICAAPPDGCDLRLLRVGDAAPTPLPTTDDPARSELHPTISGQRVAWVRPRSDAPGAVQVTYTRRLNAPARVRSTKLASTPPKGQVAELELTTNQLAYVRKDLTTGLSDDCGLWTAGQVDLHRARTTVVARTGCGIAGQHLTGVSFAGSTLYVARSCSGGQCSVTVVRWDPRTSRRALATLPREDLDGFAYTGGGAAWASGGAFECDQQPAPATDIGPCTVARVQGLRFTRLRSALPGLPSVDA